MSTMLTVSFTPAQQNALLDMLEFALMMAEIVMVTNCHWDGDGKGTYNSVEFDPDDLAVWLDDAPELAKQLDAMPEIIDQAQTLKRRLNALEAKQ